MDTFNPTIDERTPDLVRKLAGLPAQQVAERLAIEVQTLEARLATLLQLPDREAPFYAGSGMSPALRALNGQPCSEVAATLAGTVHELELGVRRLREALEAVGITGDYSTSMVFRDAAAMVRRSAPPSELGFVVRQLATRATASVRKLASWFGGDVPAAPPPHELPTSMAELVAIFEAWYVAHQEGAEVRADDDVETLEMRRYQAGKAHACLHAADLARRLAARFEFVQLSR